MSASATQLTTIARGPRLAQTRNIAGQVPGPNSWEWIARMNQAVSAAISTTMPVYAAAVVASVTRQVDAFTHTCFVVTPYDSYVRVAEVLNRITPDDFEKRSTLFKSGAEGVENSITIARSYSKRTAVVAFDHAYHGRTNLTLALTAKNRPYKSGFGPFASGVYRAPMSYRFRDGVSGAEAARRAIDQIEKQVGVENLAAIIIVPIQGEGGFIVPAVGFLPALVEWARANGVVFIADEVQARFAHAGALFASEHEGITPDLIVTAKVIAAGLPLAAVTGRQNHGLASTWWPRRSVRRQPDRLRCSPRQLSDHRG